MGEAAYKHVKRNKTPAAIIMSGVLTAERVGVGRACEWNFTRDRERNRHWQRNVGFGKDEPSPFVMEQVDEEGFHLVEQKTPAKPKWGPGARGGRGGMRGGMRWVQMI